MFQSVAIEIRSILSDSLTFLTSAAFSNIVFSKALSATVDCMTSVPNFILKKSAKRLTTRPQRFDENVQNASDICAENSFRPDVEIISTFRV